MYILEHNHDALSSCLPYGSAKIKISDVLRQTGSSRSTVTLMYKETAQKIELNALDKRCHLFECQVAHMLEFADEQG